MGGNILSRSSFNNLREREQEAVEKALWREYKKLQEEKQNRVNLGFDAANIEAALHFLREAMKKFGLMK